MMRKIKFMLVAFVSIMMIGFIPNVYATGEEAEEKYYELKLYKKKTIYDFSEEELKLFAFMLEKEELLHISDDETKSEVSNLDNKLLFTLIYNPQIIVLANDVTFWDNIEYTFTNDDKTALEENEPKLSGYSGVKLLLAEKEICDSVCIEDVELDSKSEKTKIISKPKYKDLTVKFDTKFKKLNDYAKYKIVINNSTNEDYAINEKNSFGDSKYITYEYSYEGNDKLAKKNSKTVMYVTIKYNKKVPEEEFSKGIFTENNNLIVSLDNDMSVLKNPNTGHNLLVICITLLVVIGFSLLLYKVTSNKKYLSIFIISLVVLPVSVYAAEKFQINVDSTVTIEKENLKQFSMPSSINCSSVHDFYEYSKSSFHYTYEDGMTWEEWFESDYNSDHIKKFKEQADTGLIIEFRYIPPELIECTRKVELTPDGNKLDSELGSCMLRFEPQEFTSSSLILSDGLYFWSVPCPR